MRFVGKLKSWNDERGFGFIKPVRGGKDIFVHIKAFPSGSGRPSIGQTLTFEIELGQNDKLRANSVKYLVLSGATKPHLPYSFAPWSLPRALAIPVFVVVWFYVASRWQVKPFVLELYIWLSLLTFLVYALDKFAAINGRRRTPEKTLQLLGLIGGWPGGLLAQQLLRHKSSKASFVTVFWITVVANVMAFIALHSGLLAGGLR